MSMDVGKSFTFMFQDPEWLRKLGIATIVALIGIVLSPILIGLIPLIILLGYSLEITRNVMDGQQYPMPEWENWGGFLARGFKLAVVYIVWALPIIIISIPLGIGSALANGGNRDTLNALGGLLSACGGCLAVLWGLVMMLFTPAIYVRLARTDQISSCFQFAEMWAFTRTNLSNVIIAILLSWLAGLIGAVIAFIGVFAIVIGLLVSVPFAIVWQYIVQAHLYGQVGMASPAPAVPEQAL